MLWARWAEMIRADQINRTFLLVYHCLHGYHQSGFTIKDEVPKSTLSPGARRLKGRHSSFHVLYFLYLNRAYPYTLSCLKRVVFFIHKAPEDFLHLNLTALSHVFCFFWRPGVMRVYVWAKGLQCKFKKEAALLWLRFAVLWRSVTVPSSLRQKHDAHDDWKELDSYFSLFLLQNVQLQNVQWQNNKVMTSNVFFKMFFFFRPNANLNLICRTKW